MLLFSDGGVFSNQCQHTFPPACQHIMQESGRSASNTTASLILYDEHYRMTIFRSFVLINYCSLVWNFCEAAHTSKMERIQFRALKYIYNDVSTSYEELLARANLATYQPWNCTVKGKFLWKCSNLLTTFHHIFYVGLVQSKRREL